MAQDRDRDRRGEERKWNNNTHTINNTPQLTTNTSMAEELLPNGWTIAQFDADARENGSMTWAELQAQQKQQDQDLADGTIKGRYMTERKQCGWDIVGALFG